MESGSADLISEVGTVVDGSQHESSPTLLIISRKLRKAKKRLRSIEELQAKIDEGKEINEDQVRDVLSALLLLLSFIFCQKITLFVQQNVLNSRPIVCAIIDELEKLLVVLDQAISEETALIRAHCLQEAAEVVQIAQNEAAAALAAAQAETASAQAHAAALAAAAKNSRPTKPDEEWIQERNEAVAAAIKDTQRTTNERTKEQISTATSHVAQDTIDKLIDLLYFASLFDPFGPTAFEGAYFLDSAAARYHKGHSSMEHSPEKKESQSFLPITREDLVIISAMGKLLLTRPFGTILSHKDALARCKESAKKVVMCPEEIFQGIEFRCCGKDLMAKIENLKYLDFFEYIPGSNQVSAREINGSIVHSVNANSGIASAMSAHATAQLHSSMDTRLPRQTAPGSMPMPPMSLFPPSTPALFSTTKNNTQNVHSTNMLNATTTIKTPHINPAGNMSPQAAAVALQGSTKHRQIIKTPIDFVPSSVPTPQHVLQESATSHFHHATTTAPPPPPGSPSPVVSANYNCNNFSGPSHAESIDDAIITGVTMHTLCTAAQQQKIFNNSALDALDGDGDAYHHNMPDTKDVSLTATDDSSKATVPGNGHQQAANAPPDGRPALIPSDKEVLSSSSTVNDVTVFLGALKSSPFNCSDDSTPSPKMTGSNSQDRLRAVTTEDVLAALKKAKIDVDELSCGDEPHEAAAVEHDRAVDGKERRGDRDAGKEKKKRKKERRMNGAATPEDGRSTARSVNVAVADQDGDCGGDNDVIHLQSKVQQSSVRKEKKGKQKGKPPSPRKVSSDSENKGKTKNTPTKDSNVHHSITSGHTSPIKGGDAATATVVGTTTTPSLPSPDPSPISSQAESTSYTVIKREQLRIVIKVEDTAAANDTMSRDGSSKKKKGNKKMNATESMVDKSAHGKGTVLGCTEGDNPAAVNGGDGVLMHNNSTAQRTRRRGRKNTITSGDSGDKI